MISNILEKAILMYQNFVKLKEIRKNPLTLIRTFKASKSVAFWDI